MFWIGIGVAVLFILGLTWLGARLFDPTPRHDKEDRAVIPMSDEDGPFL